MNVYLMFNIYFGIESDMFFNPYPRICLWTSEREEGGEGEWEKQFPLM